MNIEKLKSEDIPHLLGLYDELIPFEMSLEKSIENYKEIIENENYFLAVAKEDKKIIGSMLGICCKCLTLSFLVIEDVIVHNRAEPAHPGQPGDDQHYQN